MRSTYAIAFATFMLATPAMSQVIIQTPNGDAARHEERAQHDRWEARQERQEADRRAAMGDYRGAAEADREARRDLDDLQALPGLATDGDVAALASAFESFRQVRAKILSLSRENTNVHALEIAAGKMRAAKIRCQDALDELQRSIHDAPVPGVHAAPPFNPRRLRSESPGDGVHS